MHMKTIALVSHSAGLQGAEKMLLNLAILLKKVTAFRLCYSSLIRRGHCALKQ